VLQKGGNMQSSQLPEQYGEKIRCKWVWF